MAKQDANAGVIARELAWLEAVVRTRFAAYLEAQADAEALLGLPDPPGIAKAGGAYARVLRDLDLGAPERLVLILAVAPHLAPEKLDPFLLQNQATGRRFTEFGGIVGQSHNGVLPTVETALFLLAGTDLVQRVALRPIFSAGHTLVRRGVIAVDHSHGDEPPTSAVIRLSREYLEIVLTGEEYTFPPGEGFPAERINTPLNWSDLVLDTPTRQQIDMIGSWIRHAHTLLYEWDLARRLKPGYRCLFYGGPGTGKTLTACLLGKHHGLPVYRVDLSRVVSKWIGETEKNLAALFDQAQERDWILFFDEAEALFGKRTDSHSANDRAANQQIAYLLQRLEDFPGLVILSTNQRAHMDEAFARRFQSSIHFPMPDAAARRRLWEDMFRTRRIPIGPDVDFKLLAERYELAGGAIVNILRHACLLAVVRDVPKVLLADIMSGIRHEQQKEGKYFSN